MTKKKAELSDALLASVISEVRDGFSLIEARMIATSQETNERLDSIDERLHTISTATLSISRDVAALTKHNIQQHDHDGKRIGRLQRATEQTSRQVESIEHEIDNLKAAGKR